MGLLIQKSCDQLRLVVGSWNPILYKVFSDICQVVQGVSSINRYTPENEDFEANVMKGWFKLCSFSSLGDFQVPALNFPGCI